MNLVCSERNSGRSRSNHGRSGCLAHCALVATGRSRLIIQRPALSLGPRSAPSDHADHPIPSDNAPSANRPRSAPMRSCPHTVGRVDRGGRRRDKTTEINELRNVAPPTSGPGRRPLDRDSFVYSCPDRPMPFVGRVSARTARTDMRMPHDPVSVVDLRRRG